MQDARTYPACEEVVAIGEGKQEERGRQREGTTLFAARSGVIEEGHEAEVHV